MASTFPTSLDTFTNPTATSLLTSPSHSLSHSDLNDAVEALETKVGIGNTVLGTYTAYTPTLAGITIGNGTIATQYCRVNNFVHYFGTITLGSTSSVTTGFYYNLPITADSALVDDPVGVSYNYDASTGYRFAGLPILLNTTAVYSGFMSNDISDYPRNRTSSTTNPFTWAVSDQYSFNLYYKAA